MMQPQRQRRLSPAAELATAVVVNITAGIEVRRQKHRRGGSTDTNVIDALKSDMIVIDVPFVVAMCVDFSTLHRCQERVLLSLR
jgi:hypothetical protein